MSIYAASKERSRDEVRESLSNLVRDFEADPPGNRKLIRDLLDNDSAAFYSGAIELLKASVESRGVQYLVALLVANGMLLEAICDPALSREQAFALGRAAVRVDPMADAGLARGLADSESGQGTAVVRDAPRLMEVLCEVGDASRMMSSMLRLLRHPNPYLRSKAVKIVGRGSKSAKWARQRMSDADPRIRANSIEALWGVDTPDARLLLQLATSDGNNRVAANALLGLYHLGESSAVSELVKMAADDSPLFRSSAAWAMGQTGDVRFQDALRRLLSDADASARKRALAAIGRLKAVSSRKEEPAAWHVAARWAGTDQKGLRHVMVSVAGEDGREQPVVPPLGFILNENGPYVTSYRVRERPAPEAMSVIFLIPRFPEAAKAFREGIASCLKWKRTSDLWCVLPYLETGDGAPPETNLDQEPPNFTANPDAIQKILDEPARRVECVDLWSSLWRAAKIENARSRGKRYIFVCSTTEEARLAGHGIVAKASNPYLRIQAISTGPNAQLESFCKSVGAAFLRTVVDEVAETVRQTYLSLLARYEVVYQPIAANAPLLKVRVQSAEGTGETVIVGEPGETSD